MPEVPTPGVKGQVVSSPALQASKSILSFAPAARISEGFASTARPGSFCLFCENGLAGLPTLTRVSGLKPPADAITAAAISAPAAGMRRRETTRFRVNQRGVFIYF